MIPQTWEQLGIWLAMQFPVLAAVVLIARWVLRWEGERYAASIRRNDEQNAALNAEKDRRIADRDAIISEQKAEINELKARLSRRRKKGGGDAGGPKL